MELLLPSAVQLFQCSGSCPGTDPHPRALVLSLLYSLCSLTTPWKPSPGLFQILQHHNNSFYHWTDQKAKHPNCIKEGEFLTHSNKFLHRKFRFLFFSELTSHNKPQGSTMHLQLQQKCEFAFLTAELQRKQKV